MAYYTVELSSMLSAYATLLDVRTNEKSFDIIATKDGHSIRWDSEDGKYVELPLYHTEKGITFTHHDFDFFKINNPNYLIDHFVYPMCLEKCGELKDNVTDDADLNKSIIEQFLKTFWRHFYGYEIGQENPQYWWVLFKGWYDENIDFFIQNYREMIIKNQNYITGLTHTTGNMNAQSKGTSDALSSSIAGTADTPQNELNFGLNSGDPAKDYNFNYSSTVNGAKEKSTGTNTSDSNQDTTNDSEMRMRTIAELTSQLDQFFDNGIYLNLFEKAREYGLFMNVIH